MCGDKACNFSIEKADTGTSPPFPDHYEVLRKTLFQRTPLPCTLAKGLTLTPQLSVNYHLNIRNKRF